MASRERQLAAVMFSDIEGYTALMHENEPLAKEWRARHRQAFQDSHQRFSGKIIQYFGDGTLSVFESALNVVHCAIEIQQMLRTGDAEVPLRIGIHLGEIVWDGEDIFGDGVNIASRIETFSVPGAVLISDRLYEQIRNHPEISCRSMGFFKLKNVTRSVELYAVEAQGLRIPDQKQLSGKGAIAKGVQINNLPKQASSFLGRDQQLIDLQQLIRQNRLLTLTGSGGTGKTRMSIAVAESLATEFEDGVCWVPLAPLAQASQVVFAIAQALAFIQDTTQSIETLVINFLQKKHLLLLLDNFEHVTEAAPLLAQLFQHCPNLHILVTSRNPLKLYGEQEYPLTPLELPGQGYDLQVLEKNASVQLFCQRAQAQLPAFQLSLENAQPIAGICSRLDGLPLAIELAAARIKIFSPQALLARLNNNFELLKGGWIGQDTRHHTLNETIAWSYRLLNPQEQLLFQVMSVFAGGATLEAVECIWPKASLGDWDMVEGVLALMEKSLLQKEETGQGGRFYMLETIRYYARETLHLSSASLTISKAHAHYYLDLVEQAQTQLTGKDQVYWLTSLEKDQDNFRTAIARFIEVEGYAEAYRFGVALWRFWLGRSLLIEGVSQLNTLLNLPVVDEELRIKVLFALGTLYMSTTEYPKAIPIFENILAIRRNQNNAKELASVLNTIGFLLIQSGQANLGFSYTEEALEIFKTLKNQEGEAASYQNLGWGLVLVFGRPSQGHPYLETCLHIRRELKDARRTGFALTNLASAMKCLGRSLEGLKLIEEAQQLLIAVGDVVLLSWSYIIKAQLHFDLDETENFEETIEKIENQHNKNTSIKYIEGWANIFRSVVLLSNEHLHAAEKKYQQGLDIFKQLSMTIEEFYHYWQIAMYKYAQFEKAYQLAKVQMLINFQEYRPYYLLHNLEVVAMVLTKWGKIEKAVLLLARASALREAEKILIVPWLKIQMDDALGLLRKALKDQHFEALWAKGSAMPLEAIVHLALGESNRGTNGLE